MSTSWKSKLTRQEVNAYNEYFKLAAQNQAKSISGAEAVQFFAKSGLSNEILSQIWESADERNLGYLTPETFAIALKLIACAQNNIRAVEPLFSTVTPLPVFKGIQLSNNSSSSSSNSMNSPSQVISPADKKKYQSIYLSQQPTTNGIPAATAKALFARSKLPSDQLAQIWNLVDLRKNGFLDETEFIIAMHYVAKLMDKSITQLPSILPTDVYLSVSNASPTPFVSSPVMSPSLQSKAKRIDTIGNMAFSPTLSTDTTTPWDVTPKEKADYDGFFSRLDTSRKGTIDGVQAVGFFKNSRLSDHDLAKIWDLADIGSTGRLNPNEFAIAMHLIKKRKAGEELPMVLPKSLQPPSTTTSPRASFHRGSLPTSPLQRGATSPLQRGMTTPTSPLHQGFHAPEEDLLGDFGNNEQVASETNNVNLLQNQIASTRKSTTDILAQKKAAEQNLRVLQEKKQDLQNQVARLQAQAATEQKTLTETQAKVEQEKPSWESLQSDLEAAETQCKTAQDALAQLKQEYKDGQAENERLRRNVHNVQMETMRITKELDELHAINQKKQDAAAARRKAREERRLAAAELKRQQEEEAARKAAEEEAARKAEEERKRLEEEEAARKAEEERKRLEEEEAARKAEEERKRLEEEEAARKAAEEEAARKADEERKRLEAEEAARKAEEERKRLEEEEAARKAEEERKRLEEEEAARKAAEEEAARKAEEERKRLEEEEAARKAEEERKRLEEEETTRKVEEERKRLEEEEATSKAKEAARIAAEEEATRKAAEEEAARKAAEEEAARKAAEEETARKAEEERKHLEEEEAARKAKEERKHLEEEEAARKAKEERDRLEKEEAARKAEEERKRIEAEEVARKAAEEEAARKAEEERKRLEEEEAARKAEEERKRLEEEEAAAEKEKKRLNEEAERKKSEEEALKAEQEQKPHSPEANSRAIQKDVKTGDAVDSNHDKDDNNVGILTAGIAAGAIGLHHSGGSEDDVFTDSTDTEDFYDAVDSTTPMSSRKQKGLKNSEESEFVMVDHPNITQTKEAFKNKEQDKFIAPMSSNEQKLEQPVTKLSSFDAVFGVLTENDKQLEDHEEEPVLVSSLSGSEISDPFTTSTSSSTHRTAPPPPPQSRKSRSPTNDASPVNKQKQVKKPPAPPPSRGNQSQDFDTIFGTPTLAAAVNNETTTENVPHELDESEFDAVFNVTPNAEKAVPSAVSPFDEEEEKPLEPMNFDNAFNSTSTGTATGTATATATSAFQGFHDSFDQTPTETQPKVDKVKNTPPSPPIVEAAHNETKTTRNAGVRGVDESSRSHMRQEVEVEDDGKKKKKKKNIMSLAKSIGFKKKKDKGKPKETVQPVKAVSNNSSSIIDHHPEESGSFAYDVDTIQGSHIAELVNMGFEPAAALDALDRYDQDLELATNFLLDQLSR